MNGEELARRRIAANQVFTPTTPIDEGNLFAGRKEQIGRVVDTVAQKGQHALIFGERGVGKTSLANVLAQFFGEERVLAPRATCVGEDTFTSVWRKLFSEITLTAEKQSPGFSSEPRLLQDTVADRLPESITPDDVRRILSKIGGKDLLILIIDEFDRLGPYVSTSVADTVKVLSDHAVPATLVLVGVADSVDELITQHASVERALVQIPMPRMSSAEIREILERGMERLGLNIEGDALERIILLAQGLPHYAHLLALYSTLDAFDENSTTVRTGNVEAAIRRSVENAQMSIRRLHSKAASSPRPENLYSYVLLACALAPTDDLGYFTPAAVREPMSKLLGKPYDIPSFARHLYDFMDDERGPVLERTGTERKYRYRFTNPLLQPYVIMNGLKEGLISDQSLEALYSA